ncbi:MAG: hypothetical protein EA411_09805 [Saprospirales bacterium]|nr:MAG: hypothetical protein EA411_09805 [Saprospirales bacterium]
MHNTFKLHFVSALIVLISACHSIRHQGAQPAGGDYDQFFLGDNQFQYFIKPISFSSETSSLSLDITFRHPETGDTATVNFTVAGDEPQTKVKAIQIENGEQSIRSEDLEIIYQRSPSGGTYVMRYSSHFAPDEMIQQLGNPEWKVKVTFESDDQVFKAERRTRRVLNRLKSGLHSELKTSR